jgi:hypothetical protein
VSAPTPTCSHVRLTECESGDFVQAPMPGPELRLGAHFCSSEPRVAAMAITVRTVLGTGYDYGSA